MYTSITVNFNTLKLDHKNPRFVTKSGSTPSHNEVMKYLIDYEAVIELAEEIKEFGGLVPGERLLVLKDNNSYIVLEGNRRTAAITLLLKPQEIIDTITLTKNQLNKINKFIQLDDKNLINNLSKFQVDIVPNRDDAIYSLSVRHIDGIKKWSQISKMYFYQQHFDSGKNLSELKEFTGESERSIADTLRKYSFLRIVLDSYRDKYPDGKYKDSEFETQIQTELVIQRIFNSLKDKLNFKFSNNYYFKTNHYNTDQLKTLKNILADIGYLYWDLEKINTRNLNKVEQFYEVFFNDSHVESCVESLSIGKLITDLEKSLASTENEGVGDDVDSIDEVEVSDENSEVDVNGDDVEVSIDGKDDVKVDDEVETYNIYLEVKNTKQRVKVYDDFDLRNLIIKATDSKNRDLRDMVDFNIPNKKFIKGSTFSGDAPMGTYSIQAKLSFNGKTISKNLTLEVYTPKKRIKATQPNNSLFTSVTAFCQDNKIELNIDNTVNGLINEIQSLMQPEKYQLMIASSVRQLVELSVTKIINDKGLTTRGNTKDNLVFLVDEKLQDKSLFTEISKGDIKIKYNTTKNLISSINAGQLWDYLNLITHDSNSSIFTELVEKINKQIFPLLVIFHNYLKL